MSKAYSRLETILKKIVFIDEIIFDSGNITKALEDEKTARPAIMMHFTSIAEQFNRDHFTFCVSQIHHFLSWVIHCSKFHLIFP